MQAKLLRAIYSERQLEEVLTDFWFNHFNVARARARSVPADGVRARDDPPARARQVPRPAGRDREEPGDAVLSGQLAERRTRIAAADAADTRRSQRAPLQRACSVVVGRRQQQPANESVREPGTAAEARPERELRPRADGAAHARRRRRLHAEGRDRGRARASPAGRSTARGRAAASRSTRGCTTPGEKMVLGHEDQGGRRRRRRRARCSTSSRRSPRRRTSSPPKLARALRRRTRRRRRWSTARRRRSSRPMATCAK